jgi:50S ribosomal subunit-associated GTPase HflX
MSKKNFGYTSVSNIKRRLGTWDSRKPGQSPKEMKALLEGADKTLQGTKSSKPDKFIDSIVRHNTGVQKLSNSELRRLESSSGSKVVQELRQTKPKGVHHTTYRTQGKQDLLEGKPRKTTVSAKAGAGMQMLKAQMRRFGAKQWWQSKTH